MADLVALESGSICLRRLISHVDLEIFGEFQMFLSAMSDLQEQMEPITDYSTRAMLVHISGDCYTLLEVRA